MRLSTRSVACVIALSTLSLTACGTEPVSFDNLDGSGVIIGADASGTTDGSSIVDPDATSGPDGNTALDVSVSDTSTVEPDSGTDPDTAPEPDPTDAGPAPDLEPGQVCVPDSTECDGDILLTCAPDGTAVGRTRCSSRGFVCGEDADGRSACVEDGPTVDPAICVPGALTCSPDAAAVLRCNADGTAFEVATRCESGCNPDTNECNGGTVDPPVGCSDLDAEPLEQGTLNFSLCDTGDDYSYSPDGDACQFEIAGEDRIFVLTLDEPTDVFIDLKDNDSSAAIDTVLYVQTTCGDNSSQVLCTDDVPCDESDVETGCTDGFQPRQSRIEETFEPGTYYIIAEQLSYQSRRTGTRFSCGNVELIVEFNP